MRNNCQTHIYCLDRALKIYLLWNQTSRILLKIFANCRFGSQALIRMDYSCTFGHLTITARKHLAEIVKIPTFPKVSLCYSVHSMHVFVKERMQR